MNKILFICHGNICRSPMAEFIFKDMLKKCGREAEFIVVSSATSTEEIWNGIGNPVYPPARAELANHGIFCKEKRAIQLKKSDYDKYDLFLCMDSRNVTTTLQIFGGDPDNKVRKLLKNKDVSNPWYTDRFDVAYNDIYEGCRQLLESL
ncbi:MAG: low molecular weight phosphotyrosine protein phosphatase [Ruminococcus sp.]|nr:low molecular weight phosphotyrosine protein phosphatase [Ruminococcus sp.]